jgi:hypothetical protein
MYRLLLGDVQLPFLHVRFGFGAGRQLWQAHERRRRFRNIQRVSSYNFRPRLVAHGCHFSRSRNMQDPQVRAWAAICLRPKYRLAERTL